MSDYDPGNIFAKMLRGEIPYYKVFENDHTLAFMDIMPRSKGHSLVIPKSPVRNVFDARPSDLAHVYETAQMVAKASMIAFDADGMTIQQFSEPAGGQVVFHLHMHVIPRFEGESLRPHTGEMADHAILAEQAGRLANAIEHL